MKKQIIAGIIAITCVALCAAVWLRSAEVEDLPAEPIKNALSAEIEARSEETTHIFISKDVPEPEIEIIAKDEPEVTAEPVAESEPQDTEITPEEKIEKPASAGTPKPQVASKSAPASTEPKPGGRTYIDGDGKKLHMSPTSLQEQRQVNDEICRTHGFSVLEPYDGQKKKKRLTPGEYRAAMRGESWKFRLIKAIDEALEYSPDKESFILNMEYESYEVRWDDTHKNILFTTPEGRKCRDDSMHDDTYLKETLEKLFAYRAEHGYTPQTPEPPEGWLAQANTAGKLASDAVKLGKSVEKIADVLPSLTPFIPTDSKQKRREAIKKLAQGHKLQSEQEQEFGQIM